MRRRISVIRLLMVLMALAAAVAQASAQNTPAKTRARARPKQAGGQDRTAGSGISEQECRAYAAAVSKGVAAGNLNELNALVDWDMLIKNVLAGMELTADQRRDLTNGLMTGVTRDTGITGVIAKNSKLGGSFGFLRTRQNYNRQVILFRLIQPMNQGGVAYFEFVPNRSADGKVRATDIYVFSSAEFISETLKRALLPVVAEFSKGMVQKLLGGQNEYVRDLPKIEKITGLMGEGKMAEALGELKALGPETKKQKFVLMLRLRAAQSSDMQEYRAVLEDFRTLYPKDPCVDLLMIDYHTLRKEFPQAIASIDRLDKSVGGDPYLNMLRANISDAAGDSDAARGYAQRAVKEEPTLLPPYYELLGLSLKQQKYDDTLEALKQLDQRFQTKFNDLTTVAEYAGFVKSPQYKQWLAYLADKGKGAQPAPRTGPARTRSARPGSLRSKSGN